jgi:hypothetical protein
MVCVGDGDSLLRKMSGPVTMLSHKPHSTHSVLDYFFHVPEIAGIFQSQGAQVMFINISKQVECCSIRKYYLAELDVNICVFQHFELDVNICVFQHFGSGICV